MEVSQIEIESLQRRVEELEAQLSRVKNSNGRQGNNAGGKSNEGSCEDTELLKTFMNLTTIGISRCAKDGTIIGANDAYLSIIGYSREELAARQIRWQDISASETAERDAIGSEEIGTTGKAKSYEKEYIHKDGHHVPVLIAVSSINKGGDDLGFIIDLSSQKRTEQLLRDSEAQFRLLADAVPQIIWIADPDRNVTFANQRFFDYTGLRREEDYGRLWRRVVHPLQIDRYLDNWRRSASFPGAYEMEVRYLRADGVYRWHLARAIPVTNTKNELLVWFGTSTDIDDQKHIEEEIKESEIRFRTLADAIPQIVWTASPDGRIDFFNHRWFEYTGLTWDESVNDGWSLLIHPDDVKSYLREWKRALANGDTCEREFRLKRAVGKDSVTNNDYRWHLGRAVALRDKEGSIEKWFATWTEIEDQKKGR